MIRLRCQSGAQTMPFSWGYIWRKWRATLQVEPLFLETNSSLTRAALPAGSQPVVFVEGSGASIEQSSANSVASPDPLEPPPSRW
jgi:hypothetical protein